MNHESNPKPYIVLVGVDYSESGSLALVEAIRLARAHGRSHIHLVHAIPGMPPLAPALASSDPLQAMPTDSATLQGQLTIDMSSDMKAYVEKALAKLGDPPASFPLAWTMHLRLFDPAHAIAQLAADLEADLVVIGTHGRKGLARFLLGSVAEGVVRLAPCPVLVVRPVGAQSAAEGTQIEPPCPECIQTRAASAGNELWCERHGEHHGRAHTYHFTPFRESHQSGLLLHPLK